MEKNYQSFIPRIAKILGVPVQFYVIFGLNMFEIVKVRWRSDCNGMPFFIWYSQCVTKVGQDYIHQNMHIIDSKNKMHVSKMYKFHHNFIDSICNF